MELGDLKQSISSMTDVELLTLLKDIRASRRLTPGKKSVKTGVEKERTAKKTELDLEKILAGMSPEMLSKFMSKVGG